MHDDSEIGDLIRRIGERGSVATPDELTNLRERFGLHVLPTFPTRRVRLKHDQHVATRREWPVDTTEEEYLDSLREVVTDGSASTAG